MKYLNHLERPVLLSTLWVVLMLNYIYADVLGLYDPGHLIDLQNGTLGGFPFSPDKLVAAGVLMQIPIGMVLLSRLLPRRVNRWITVFASIVMTVVQVGSLLFGSSPSPVYVFFSVIEIAVLLEIIGVAVTWRRTAARVAHGAEPVAV